MKMPDTVFPCAAVSESDDGKAWSIGVNELAGGGGGGVVEGGGGGGVVDGGGGVVEGGGVVDGGGGGVVVPVAMTASDTGLRKICDPLGPLSEIYTTPV